MSTTIRDVAREAAVSTSTVSKVLNNWTTISPETTRRVKDAIKKLNYVPNSRAVSFASRSTRNIIFLASLIKDSAFQNPHMYEILCGARQELAKAGYTLMIQDIPPGEDPCRFLAELISQKVGDGILLHGSAYSPSMAQILLDQQFPHILIGHPERGSRICWIDTNNGMAGEYSALYMIERGYTQTAFIGGYKNDAISAQRLNGFLGAMQDYGYSVPEDYICFTDSSKEGGEKAMEHLLRLAPPPRAVVCENNTLAVGAIQAINQQQLNVPSQIALLTFDKYPYSQIITPAPTIVDIDVYDLGIQAAVMLLRKIENPSLLIQSYTTLPVITEGATL